MLSGLNHITFSVSDLERSFRFYVELLGVKPVAKWLSGAYLLVGDLWLCLSVDKACRSEALSEYSHIAFSIPENTFLSFSRSLIEKGCILWKENSSEGDSLYILDPDGHKLEIHVGNLQSRLESLKVSPYDGLVLF